MPAGKWEKLVGAVIEGRYRLRALAWSAADQAEFSADESGRTVAITFVAASPEDVEAMRSQMEFASRLDHPNLLRVLATGQTSLDGEPVLYLATEPSGESLAAALKAGPLGREAAAQLAGDILSAFAYLHEQGFVYRSLAPETTVRVQGRWKLADFTQVSKMGPESAPPGYDSPYQPPEAATGPILPAWDIWSLGVLLREALGPQQRPPFDAIVEGCVRREPHQRLPAGEIRRMLGSTTTTAAAPPPPVSPATAPGAWKWLQRASVVAIVGLAALLPFALRKKPAAPAAAPPAAARTNPPARKPPAAKPASARPVPAKALPARPEIPAQPTTKPAPAAGRAIEPKAGAQGEVGLADYASGRINGRRTASGEPFNSDALTAANNSHPFGTRLKVTNLNNQRSVVVRVNDRARFRGGHILRVSERAARELGMRRRGIARVRVEPVD